MTNYSTLARQLNKPAFFRDMLKHSDMTEMNQYPKPTVHRSSKGNMFSFDLTNINSTKEEYDSGELERRLKEIFEPIDIEIVSVKLLTNNWHTSYNRVEVTYIDHDVFSTDGQYNN